MTLIGEPAGAIIHPINASVTLVVGGGQCDHGRGRGRGGDRRSGDGRGGDGRGGGGGSGRGGRQMRLDEMTGFKVANRIAETQGGDRQGALNAGSPRDGGRGWERQQSESDARRRSWEGRPQQQRGEGGGRDSPRQWPSDERRGSPRNQDSDRPSHNRLDEATLSSDPARAARAQAASETLKILYEE
ncbi:hypothetical protein FRC01_006147, partial [Tulasnella sp. 417]